MEETQDEVKEARRLARIGVGVAMLSFAISLLLALGYIKPIVH